MVNGIACVKTSLKNVTNFRKNKISQKGKSFKNYLRSQPSVTVVRADFREQFTGNFVCLHELDILILQVIVGEVFSCMESNVKEQRRKMENMSLDLYL